MPRINGNYWYVLNKYGKIVFEDIDDAADGYNQCTDLIMSQTRWVLDNMDYVKEFQVPWLGYSSREFCKKEGRVYAASAPYHHENKTYYTSKKEPL